jgi:hypothetical protein
MSELLSFLQNKNLNKPSITEQINKISTTMEKVTNTLKSLDDINNLVELDSCTGISVLENDINIIESYLTVSCIDENEPYKKEQFRECIAYTDYIFKYVREIKMIYDEYLDYPINEIKKIKEIGYLTSDNKLDVLTETLNKSLMEKKERFLFNIIRVINLKRLDIFKNLGFILKTLIKINNMSGGFSSMSY